MEKKPTLKQERAHTAMMRAVASYIESMGGSAKILGPVFVARNGESKRSYSLQIEIVGARPKKKI